jgi:hypothetical protein
MKRSSLRTTSLAGEALTAAALTLAAVVLWVLLYLGASARVKGIVVLVVSLSAASAFVAYVIVTRLPAGRALGRIRLHYLLFSVLVAVPVYVSLAESFVNTHYGDVITTRRASGLAITLLLAVLIVVVYQVVGFAIRRWSPRWDRPLSALVAVVSLVVPHLATNARGRQAFEFPATEVRSRAVQTRTAPAAGRIVALGIDGATWDVMGPLLATGRLPHLQRIIEGGSYGQLISDSGARSPVVWTTIFTGQPPAVHGIDSWERSVSTNRRVKSLWNILNEFGRSVTVINVPGTYPTEQVEGVMLAGFPAPMPERNNYGWFFATGDAASLGVDIPGGRIIYDEPSAPGAGRLARLRLSVTIPARIGALVEQPERLLSQRYNLQNLFVNFMVRRELLRAGRSREITLFAHPHEDESVGLGWSESELLATVRPGEWSPPLRLAFDGLDLYVQARLIRHDPESTEIYISPLYPSKAAGSPDVLRAHPSERLPAALPEADYIIEGPGWGSMANNGLVRACLELQQEVFRRQAAYAQALARAPGWDAYIAVFTVTDRIQHAFWKFREPAAFPEVTVEQAREFGPAIDDAYIEVDRQIGEIASGLREDDLLVIVSDHGFRSSGGGSGSQQSGVHAREGIFILHGRQIRPSGGFRAERMPVAELVQVTPTILYLAGMPVGEDMTGGIIREVIAEDVLRARPVEKIPSYDEAGGNAPEDRTLGREAIEQLKSLGYVQ